MANTEEQKNTGTEAQAQQGSQGDNGDLTEEQIAQRILWVSRGIGFQVQRSYRRRAGREAGLDAHRWFYVLPADMVTLAVREDCMKAYLTDFKFGVSIHDIRDQLEQLNIPDPKTRPVAELQTLVEAGQWVPVAEGREPRGMEWVQYLRPGETGEAGPKADVEALSDQYRAAYSADSLDADKLQDTRALAAAPGDVIAKVRKQGREEDGEDIFGRPLKRPDEPIPHPQAGDHVELVDDEYRAQRYGYVCMDGGCLSIGSPLWMSQDAISVHWCLFDRRPREMKPEMIKAWLDDLGVTEGIKDDAIGDAIGQIGAGTQMDPVVLVGEGTPPTHGKDTELDILVEWQRDAGNVDEEGRIDFSGADFSPNVEAGQLIARLTPSTEGEPGRDLRGQPVEARRGVDRAFDPGNNVETRIEDGLAYYATAEGVARLSGTKLQLWEVLEVSGDVSFGTGNLDYNGTVVIAGTIRPAFNVKATGDIVVAGGIERGAIVVCQGNLLVGEGISGRKTKITCLGDVNTQFVNEATVQSARTVHIRNYSHNAFLRASNIKVYKAEGQRGGSIVGGETWGLRSAEALFIGNTASLTTSVHTGMELAQVEKLELLNKKLYQANSQVAQMLERFSMDKVDVPQIKRLLAASSGPRQKVLARAAHQLGQFVQAQQKLLTEKKELETKASGRLGDAYVQATIRAYPNTKICMGEHFRILKDELTDACFRFVDGDIAVEQSW